MTKRIVRIAVAAAAASAFALPAAPASACSWTFVDDCVRDLLAASVASPDPICYDFKTFIVCVP